MLSSSPSAPRFMSAQPWFASVPADLQERLRNEVVAVQGDKGAVMMPAGSAVEGWVVAALAAVAGSAEAGAGVTWAMPGSASSAHTASDLETGEIGGINNLVR